MVDGDLYDGLHDLLLLASVPLSPGAAQHGEGGQQRQASEGEEEGCHQPRLQHTQPLIHTAAVTDLGITKVNDGTSKISQCTEKAPKRAFSLF